MQNMDGINFKSKINFVDSCTFNKLKLAQKAGYDTFVEGKRVCAHNVRTCTGAVCVDRKRAVARACHNYDCPVNANFADVLAIQFLHDLDINKVFLIGGKKLSDSKSSIPLFHNFKRQLAKMVKKLTIFEEHTYPYSETDFHYDCDTDTLTVCSMFKRPKEVFEHYISNMDELNECFKKVTIAKDDQLYFNDVPVKSDKKYNPFGFLNIFKKQ